MTENFENVNHLVLNFYPDGYSIAVKLNEFPVFTSETILETARISYEETSLLDYIENEELPPLLVEMIDSSPKLSQYKIWHNGSLILEVRDKIDPSSSLSSSNNSDNSNEEDKLTKGNNFFILLKPTNLSMLYDVLNLTGSKCWSTQERLRLESQIVLHNSPSLILEPDAPETAFESPPSHWPIMINHDNSESELASSSNKYSNCKSKQSTSYKERLKDIYTNRSITVTNPTTTTTTTTKTNGNSKKNNNNNNNNNVNNNVNNNNIGSSNTSTKARNLFNNQSAIDRDALTPDSLPPELTLQQFLALKRTTKKLPLPMGQIPRFHRFKRYNNHQNHHHHNQK